MRAYLEAQAEHRVSDYELPPELKRKIIERLGPISTASAIARR